MTNYISEFIFTLSKLTWGAASNIVNSLFKCSSNSNIAATLPHLQGHYRLTVSSRDHKIYITNCVIWTQGGFEEFATVIQTQNAVKGLHNFENSFDTHKCLDEAM